MDCKDVQDMLVAYSDDEVRPEERVQVQAHLAACRRCREELEAIASCRVELRRSLGTAAGTAPPPSQAWAELEGRLEHEERPQGALWGLARSTLRGGGDRVMRGLVSRQPVWKVALVATAAVAIAIGLSVGIPHAGTASAYAQAADMAYNSPEVRDALGGDVATLSVVKVVDGVGTVVCGGELGALVVAEVDLELKAVNVVLTPKLTEAEEQEAIAIAAADPGVQGLLDQGATIGGCSPLYAFGMRVSDSGEREPVDFSLSMVQVQIEMGDRSWAAHVDLDEGTVAMLIETTPMGPDGLIPGSVTWDGEEFHPTQ
ncbi:MAG: zf-HC2 domain-containing protein [Chloroflexota bacterium]|nr:zf-HC2 domain-containing protein [Chloroflexota bacterium]